MARESTAARPLAGITVVDAASWVAGPWCAQVLSWLGAGVVKVDPPGGDPLRQLDDGPASVGRCLDDDANRGKRRVATGSDAEYAATVRRLLAGAGVLVCDWMPARARALGLDLSRLRAEHPTLVIVNVTAYGSGGPDDNRPGCELTIYHAAGEGATLPSENIARHFPDRPPVRAGMFLADHDTGLTAALGAVAALVGRTRSGRGELVEIAALDVAAGLNRTTLSRALAEGRDFDRTYRGYDYAGCLRCTDGWVAIRPVEAHQWRGLCAVMNRADLLDDPRFRDRESRFDNADALTVELEGWTSARTRAQARAALLTAGCPGGPFLSPGDVLADGPIASRELFGPLEDGGGMAPVRAWHATTTPVAADPAARPGGARRWPRPAAGALPLAGLRVVDLTWVAAGPYATELLAFLGAEVVRVESRTRPDIFRRGQGDPAANLDSSIRWMDLNQAKKSVLVDLKDPAGRDRVLTLVEGADVLAENYRPGVRDRLGLGDEALHARNPSLVVLALSGFGTAAADADRPGYASIFNAEGGLGWMTGYPDAPPSDVRDTNDLRGGTLGALATVSALAAAAGPAGSGGGPGAVLDVATRDALVVLQGHLAVRASRGDNPVRAANTLDCCVPYNCFRAADGRWVAIGVRTDDEWRAFTRVTGVAGPAARPDRVAARAALDRAVATWVADRPGSHAVAILAAAGVPAGLSAGAGDLARDPHTVARGLLRSVEHPRLGTITLVQAPFVLGCARPAFARPPLLGEHDAEIFAGRSGQPVSRPADRRPPLPGRPAGG
jgi:crotonobetainyl-CoA:carnitine CoA-transferase CaiB-like acyl-CoA transferase